MKIGISGTHATGKTTIMNLLKEDYAKLNLVSEAARDCPFPLNEDTTFKTQEWILRTMIKREADAPLDEITLSDRTVYDVLAYAWYAHEKGNITEEEMNLLDKYVFSWGRTYDHVIYLPIEFPNVSDGVRSEDEEYRKDIDKRIVRILKRYVSEERLTVISGTPEERKERVKELMYKLKDAGTL